MHQVRSAPPAPTRRRTPAAGAAAALAVASGVLLVLVAVGWQPLLDFDASIARHIHRWAVAEPGATHLQRILTDWVWDPWTMRVLCALVVVLLWRRGDRPLALWVGGACALTTLAQQALKAAVGRERPSWPDPVDSAQFAAFPSGHAMTATAVCGLLVWLLYRSRAGAAARRAALAVAAVSVAGVGWTRVWLGVHWPTDVLAGWLFGALAVALTVLTYDRAGRGRAAREAA